MFLSRGIEGYDLAYASQREDENRRTLRRARYLRARFGSEQGLASHPIPPRPRRMRETTYWRYVDDLLKIERRLEAQFDMFSSRYEGRFIRSEPVGRS